MHACMHAFVIAITGALVPARAIRAAALGARGGGPGSSA